MQDQVVPGSSSTSWAPQPFLQFTITQTLDIEKDVWGEVATCLQKKTILLYKLLFAQTETPERESRSRLQSELTDI